MERLGCLGFGENDAYIIKEDYGRKGKSWEKRKELADFKNYLMAELW